MPANKGTHKNVSAFTCMVLQTIKKLPLICKHEIVADACVQSQSANLSADLNLKLFASPVFLL